MKFTLIVYPRVLFGHLDGYGHITNLPIEHHLDLVLDSSISEHDLLERYYLMWSQTFLLYIAERYRFRRLLVYDFDKYISILIESTLKHFFRAYVDVDLTSSAITFAQAAHVRNNFLPFLQLYMPRISILIQHHCEQNSMSILSRAMRPFLPYL